MGIYKITFANNTIVACRPANNKLGETEEYTYEHANGKLIFALVKADTEADAMKQAGKVVEEFKIQR